MNMFLTLSATTPVEVTKSLWDELWSNWYRLGTIVIVAGLVGVVIGWKLKKWLAVPATLGVAWLTWHAFNAISGYKSDKLVIGERTPTGMFDLWFNGGPAGFLVFAFSFVGTVATFLTCKRRGIGGLVSFIAAIGTGAFITLVYSIFVYFHG